MARKFQSTEVYLKPDPKYNSVVLSKFINCIMLDGKKTAAQKIVYDAFELMKERITETGPLEVFEKAVENVKPFIEVRSRRIGGANYQVPVEVRPRRKQSLAFRWIIAASRGTKGKPMHRKLADELCNAFKGEGTARKKRDDVHRMAEANKAFAHFAW
ncbi:MAG: 30S ribosomal protein S7 [Planctomycetes bacterium]|nr:30S ribosomal protein S7 [Planctomycetota bacterium]